MSETGIEIKTGIVRVKIDPIYHRPAEVETLLGDALKANKELKWKPKISTKEMLVEMMEHDLDQAKREKHIIDGGFKK
jgi:GDPmannose 4,6-dehydratase